MQTPSVAVNVEKRIIVLNSLPYPSAIYRYSNDVVSALNSYGKIVNVIYDKNSWSYIPDGSKYFGNFGNHYIINALMNHVSLRPLYKELNLAISKGSFVHYSHESLTPFRLPLDASIVTIHENPHARLKTDLYYSYNGFFKDKLNTLFRTKLYELYKKFVNVIAVSNYVKRGLIDFGFDANIEVIYPPVSKEFHPISDKEGLRRKLGLPLDKILILSVSTDVKRKNLAMVKEAMDRLGDDYRLVRVGSDIGIGYNFQQTSGELLNIIYNACDLLLFPTLAEGFGYPVVEALSVGLPVVSSDIDVIRETAGNSAVLVNPYSIQEILNGTKEALNSVASLKLNGLLRAKEFTFEIFVDKIVNYYKSIGYTF